MRMASRRNLKRPHGSDQDPPPPEPVKRHVSFECSICSCFLDEPTETEMSDARLKRMYQDKIQVVSLPCGHLFHEVCLQKWFYTKKVTGNNRRCPICAERLTSRTPNSNPIIKLHPSISDDGPECKRCKMLEDQVNNLRNQGQGLDDGPQEAVLDGNQDQADIGGINDDDNDSGNSDLDSESDSEDDDDDDSDSDESDESDDDESSESEEEDPPQPPPQYQAPPPWWYFLGLPYNPR